MCDAAARTLHVLAAKSRAISAASAGTLVRRLTEQLRASDGITDCRPRRAVETTVWGVSTDGVRASRRGLSRNNYQTDATEFLLLSTACVPERGQRHADVGCHRTPALAAGAVATGVSVCNVTRYAPVLTSMLAPGTEHVITMTGAACSRRHLDRAHGRYAVTGRPRRGM